MAAIVLLGGLMAACGRSEYRYVSNRQHGNFFKVPSSWHLQNATESDDEGRPAETPDGIERVWHTTFDNAPVSGQPTLSEEKLPEQVAGSGEIYVISGSNRERLSMSAVRAMAFELGDGGIDPLFPPDELAPRIRLVAYQDVKRGEGDGSRVVANVNVAQNAEDERWVTIDVSMVLDTVSRRVYVLKMLCASSCYLQNRAAIDEIAASWTVNT